MVANIFTEENISSGKGRIREALEDGVKVPRGPNF